MNSVWFISALLLFAALMAIPWERMGPPTQSKEREERGMPGQRLPLSIVADSNEGSSDRPAVETNGLAQECTNIGDESHAA